MSAVILHDDEPKLPAQPVSTPMELLSRALDRGATVEQMKQIMELQERMEANQARREFNQAFAAFKAEAIHVVKGTLIKDGPLKGKKHANLFDVVDAVTAKLAAHGMTISWRLTKDEKDWMEVTCTLRHVAGHYEQVSMASAPDAGPGRNAIQARASAKTYLERYTATAILGLAATDEDDDGAATGDPAPAPGQKVNPRPDVRKVDQVRAEQLFKSIVDILSQDIEEKDKALDLVDIHEQLRTDDAMYSLIADKLAKDGIINKSGFKALIKIGLEESRKDLRL